MATPLSIQTTPSFASLTGTAPITIPVPIIAGGSNTATIGSIVLPVTNPGGRVFIEGVIPLALTLTLPAATITGGIDVILSVYRSATATTPIYNIRKTIFNSIGLVVAAIATTAVYDVLPFQFVETPGVPLCANTSSYFFTVTVVTTGLTLAVGSTVTINAPLVAPPVTPTLIPEVFNIVAQEVPDPITVTTTTTTVIS
ncbi:hypothetical protein [Clostridium manihotivorum]|uniref:Uncharacterized protein n=1 Tax=Clostridium manihotivorum TaxID=2320868 RepID=A0A410DRC3_9CLOT|nr:hypothetical protein [Clostridium manihotivorum]QAA31611.1 hypothetical protein C1I91_08115 [Clostridium manihotivorum]